MRARAIGFAIAVSAAIAAVSIAARQAPPPPAFDVVLRHGTILDGTGAPARLGDLAIVGDAIAAVGDLSSDRGALEIDATGLDVAPGFINIHSHATAGGLARAENMLTQGVTTEILNPDGGGPTDLTAQLTRLTQSGLAVNAGAYIGFNSIWAAVVGPVDRRPTTDDIAKMRAMVVDGLTRGGWGVSAGLDYKPAYFSRTDEVIRVVEAARAWRTNFPNHERLTPETNYLSRAGIAETIQIGEAAGLVPVVTHMKVQGASQGTASDVLTLIHDAASRGHYAAADVYPYLAGQTSLSALLVPGWAQDGGRPSMLERFKDPALRSQIVAEIERAMNARFNGPSGVYLPTIKRELTDVIREHQASPGETVVRLLEDGEMTAILRFGAEPDLMKILQDPIAAIACDCGAATGAVAHPRFLGTFPRVLGHYVRETQALTMPDAIRKMTGLPAGIVGLVDRGFLAPGMAADVTVFDPRTIADHATYDEPAAPSDGIRFVFVNGRLALRDGTVTGDRAGIALRRTTHMPSRPMSASDFRHVTGAGQLALTPESARGGEEGVEVFFDLLQTGDVPRATGSFRLTDRRSGIRIDMRSIGLIQVAPNWATFTGRVAGSGTARDRWVRVVVDGGDPESTPDRTTLVVDTEDGYHVQGSLPSQAVEVIRRTSEPLGPRRRGGH